MKQLNYVLDNEKEVLNFLKSRFSMFHLSNFFFRDLQYGIQSFLKEKGMKVSYRVAERIAREFAQKLEVEKIFVPIDRQTWAVQYPEFRTPVVKPAPAAKPAAPAARPSGQPAAPAPATIKASGE